SCVGDDIGAIQQRALEDLSMHCQFARDLPSTLIHNDFNPRNIALRESRGNLSLCAYDWEMARVGLPQHDLAELLCFVLTKNVSKAELYDLIELHRGALEQESGSPIDKDGWLAGFRLFLLDLLINRCAMYTMVHRFRRQLFL